MSSFVPLPLVLYPSRGRFTLLLLFSLTFVAGGVWLVRTGKPFGYLCIALFGLCALVFAVKLHPGLSYLRLQRDGFTFGNLFLTRQIPWGRVQAFGVIPFGRQRLVAWNYVPATPTAGPAISPPKRFSGYQAMLPDNYGMQPQLLADLLNDLCRQHGGSGFHPPPRRPAL